MSKEIRLGRPQAVPGWFLGILLMLAAHCLLQAQRSLVPRFCVPWMCLEGPPGTAGGCRAQPQWGPGGPLMLQGTGAGELSTVPSLVAQQQCHLRVNLPGKGPEAPGASGGSEEWGSGLSAGFPPSLLEVLGGPSCAPDSAPGSAGCWTRSAPTVPVLGTAWPGPRGGEHCGPQGALRCPLGAAPARARDEETWDVPTFLRPLCSPLLLDSTTPGWCCSGDPRKALGR